MAKFLLVNDQATLTDMGAVDMTAIFPQDAMLCIQTLSDTTASILYQGSNDVDDEDAAHFTHADATVSATNRAFRNVVDDIVAVVNNDSRKGVGVLFDALNYVYLDNMTAGASTNVVED